VDPETLLLTPKAVAKARTARTRAVIPVHLYGQMCDMRAIREACDEGGGIRIVEDAAHCFEGSRGGDKPGVHSDAAIFSFYATKNVTCGEGGALVTHDAALADTIRMTRLHGMSVGAEDRHSQGRFRPWDMMRMGVKANLPDVLACLLPPQIERVDQRLPLRHALAQRYRAAFEGRASLRLVAQLPDAVSAHHLFPIHVAPERREALVNGLMQAGIGVTVNYGAPPLTHYYRQKYGYRPEDFPVAWRWGEGTLSLPLFPGLREDEQDYVIATVLHLAP
jgi:dTDP-4-amino-4,6-dideoxygalactose transaminase